MYCRSLTDFGALSINVLVLQWSEANQELSLELFPRRDSVIAREIQPIGSPSSHMGSSTLMRVGGQRRLVAVRAVIGDDKGYGRGQQCSYVVGEAAIDGDAINTTRQWERRWRGLWLTSDNTEDKGVGRRRKQRRLKERAVVATDSSCCGNDKGCSEGSEQRSSRGVDNWLERKKTATVGLEERQRRQRVGVVGSSGGSNLRRGDGEDNSGPAVIGEGAAGEEVTTAARATVGEVGCGREGRKVRMRIRLQLWLRRNGDGGRRLRR
ncbi:hypothetical protein B296_00034241 [Ensete ventricosum]|uniref:Uncharacterized protein n=1 Tax=Ensete ventricosum TaxID=4639 RepID=A0A426Z1M8_ENSVE|nr:hypothetical protein B296_00034241 [Ensete ventricosum]